VSETSAYDPRQAGREPATAIRRPQPMPHADDNLPWPPAPARRAVPSRDDLMAPATQIVRNRDEYLGTGEQDVGRRIAEDHFELFVTGDVAHAVGLELDRLQPEFIAVHDAGGAASLRLVTALAGAARRPVQKLAIRRQGPGVPLAVVQFVEIPIGAGKAIRIYSTDVDADSLTRQQLALVLLSHSRIGAVMVSDLPPHALAAALQPLQQAIAMPTWRSRDLLLMPLGSGAALAALASQLAGRSGVSVRVTPQAGRPNDAWSYISGAWNRLHDPLGGDAAIATDIAHAVPPAQVPRTEAPTQPMTLDQVPMPPVAPLPMPVPGGVRWDEYAERCARIKGAVSVCVFDQHSQRPIAHAGGRPPAERLTAQGMTLLAAMSDAGRALGLGATAREAVITLASHHLLLRPVPKHPGIVLHLVVDANVGNATLAKMQLERIDP
jgi:hypothetical protein